MAISATKPLFFLLIFIFLFPCVVLSEIRNYNIVPNDQGELFLDSFFFKPYPISSVGYLKLKITNITSLSNSSSYYNLTDVDIGFFLSPHKLTTKLSDFQLFPLPPHRHKTTCFLHHQGGNSFHVYPLDKFMLGIGVTHTINTTGVYNLYFQNCVHDDDHGLIVNVQSVTYNLHNACGHPLYLSPTKNIAIKINSFFSLVHYFLVCFWGYYILHLNNNKLATVKSIHVLMLFVPFLKAWSLLLEILHHYYILYTGCAQCYPSLLLTFASNFLSEGPLLLLLVLSCIGWSLVKPNRLLGKDMFLVIATVHFQVFLSSDVFWTDKRTGSEITHLYPRLFLNLGSLYKIGILFKAIRLSTEFLKDSGIATYGKALISVWYIKLFKLLLSAYAAYCACQGLVDKVDLWDTSLFLGTLLRELTVVVFYVYIAHKLRPQLHELEPLMIDDDAEKAACKALLNCPKI